MMKFLESETYNSLIELSELTIYIFLSIDLLEIFVPLLEYLFVFSKKDDKMKKKDRIFF